MFSKYNQNVDRSRRNAGLWERLQNSGSPMIVAWLKHVLFQCILGRCCRIFKIPFSFIDIANSEATSDQQPDDAEGE